MELEQASAGDLDAIHALVERSYRGDSARLGWSHEADLLGGQRTDRESLASLLADQGQYLLVRRGSVGIHACIAVSDKGGGTAYIGMVTVEPRLQRGGTGRMLLAAAELFAASTLGASRVEMTVIAQRTELIAWYERRGYRLTGERRPFPLADPRFGIPKRQDLEFVVLEKAIRSPFSGA